jgi:hypothetical protein
MSACSTFTGPAITEIYYDDDGNCYASRTSTTPIEGVNLIATSSVVLKFFPQDGVDLGELNSPTGFCGDNNSSDNVTIDGNGTSPVIASFDLSRQGEDAWGWDFSGTTSPSPIKIKVRVRRSG